MNQYYSYDLSFLKNDVIRVYGQEQENIIKQKEDKIHEIATNLRVMMNLAQ